jgi:hypothetical protein
MTNRYLTKLATLSTDTKKEVAQTGVMAAAGGATGYLGHKLMQTGAVKRMKIPEGGKAALAIGGLGLLGDYAAVKINRGIEKKASLKERLVGLIKRKTPQTLEQRMTTKAHNKYLDKNKPSSGFTDHKRK